MEPRTLAGGLLLRTGTEADADALEAFTARIHGDDDDPDTGLGVWARDLALGRHPTFRAADFLLVTEPHDGAIVSSANLLTQTWTYDGVPFGVGQPELVGTDPAYRNRGLVREQFAVLHRWCEERDLPVQAIGGIRWYYRQFGYEYALPGWAGRRLPIAAAEGAAAGAAAGTAEDRAEGETAGAPPVRLRPAVTPDAALLARLSARADARYAVTHPRDEDAWHHELTDHSEGSDLRYGVDVLVSGDGPVGMLVHSRYLGRGAIGVLILEVEDGTAWLDVLPAVLRHLLERGREVAEQRDEPLTTIEFGLGEDHPVYALLPRSATAFLEDAWYLRVPDLAGLLRLLTPALERRLADSPAAGVSGELMLSFYRSGLRLAFRRGRLATVEAWPTPALPASSAAFPDLTFLKLLFGYRSLDQLADAYPDVAVRSDRARAVLTALFPRRPSTIWHTA